MEGVCGCVRLVCIAETVAGENESHVVVPRCGLIASGVFYLKVDDGNRGTFEAEGSKPFTYRRKGQKKAVAMSYWEVPADVLESREALCQWTRAAHAAALRSKAKTGKR